MDTGSLLWLLSVITAGLAAGAMLGEFLLLGPFQSWFFETGNSEMFRKSYVQFRKTRRSARIFNAVYIIALLAGIAYLVFLLVSGKIAVLPIVAIVLQWLFLLVFYGSGFAGLEHKIFDGNTSKELTDKFRSMNVPSLGIYALLWCASFFILVFMRVQ
jgi:hypothetical protein